MSNREAALASLKPGDIFQSRGSNGGRPPCLVLDITGATLTAKAMTTHRVMTFDRKSGMEISVKDGVERKIHSIALLPDHIQEGLFIIYRKYDPATGGEYQKTCPEGHFASDRDHETLLFLSQHYNANRLPTD